MLRSYSRTLVSYAHGDAARGLLAGPGDRRHLEPESARTAGVPDAERAAARADARREDAQAGCGRLALRPSGAHVDAHQAALGAASLDDQATGHARPAADLDAQLQAGGL